jgi:N-acetylneuraminate synthase
MPLEQGRCYVIGEIGINHNGSLDLALRLMESAAEAGCDAVKFQKRTVQVVYSRDELLAPRASPFGTTNGDLKNGLEFGQGAYESIFRCGEALGLDVFASVWDVDSVTFLEQFDPPYLKVPSPLLTNEELLWRCKRSDLPLILSTGMSTFDEVKQAVRFLDGKDLVLLHCTSSYPCPAEDINLRGMEALSKSFGLPVGYSGHESGLWPTIAAVALGGVMVERHITMSRDLWGSDQKISLEPRELQEMVRAIRDVELAMGDGQIGIRESEFAALKKLRRAWC